MKYEYRHILSTDFKLLLPEWCWIMEVKSNYVIVKHTTFSKMPGYVWFDLAFIVAVRK
jgi:hypothetical protein